MRRVEASPAIIVIFGITGDLAKRKLLPALYHLMDNELLHPHTQIVGVTRQKLTKNDVLVPLQEYAATQKKPSTASRRFKDAFHLLQIDIARPGDYEELGLYLSRLEKKFDHPYQRLFYLSIPPAVFDEVVSMMGHAGLHKPFKAGPKPALLIEKPFGYDLESAKKLIKSAREYFDESQLYRIDHYLAKEMAMNILAFRQNNPLFAAVWDAKQVEEVIITAYESIGIEGRAQFYEQTGALRDLIQSHLLQMLCLVAMEVPRQLDSDIIHKKRIELLHQIKPLQPFEVPRETVRGQYAGYRDEVQNAHSGVETYAAMRLFIESDRWHNVPFILRTGKALNTKRTDIEIHFDKNILTLRLQPHESISITIMHKRPGHGYEASEAEMDFSYERSYPGLTPPEAYERVLLDAINQDQTLFVTSEEVLTSWKIVEPILQEWAKSTDSLQVYQPGSEGPNAKLFTTA